LRLDTAQGQPWVNDALMLESMIYK
jgi:hypothetical protein